MGDARGDQEEDVVNARRTELGGQNLGRCEGHIAERGQHRAVNQGEKLVADAKRDVGAGDEEQLYLPEKHGRKRGAHYQAPDGELVHEKKSQ